MSEPCMRSRSVEMYFAIVMILMGVMFATTGGNMSNPVYITLKAWLPVSELTFGALLVATGAMRITAISNNDTCCVAPIARMAGCFIGSGIWTVLLMAYFDAPVNGSPIGAAWVLPAFAFETFAAVRAAEDAYAQDSFGLRGRKRDRINSGAA